MSAEREELDLYFGRQVHARLIPDQLANFTRHLWPAAARPRLPSPEPAYFLPNQFCEAVLKSSIMSRKRAALIRRRERSQSPHETPSARTPRGNDLRKVCGSIQEFCPGSSG